MNNLQQMFLFVVSLVFIHPVFAHPGHDHSHWSAELLHYGFYISTAIMIAVVMYCMVRLLTADNVDCSFRDKPKAQH